MNQIQKITQPATILIVDDTHANLSVLSEMLTRRGYIPRPVPSGRHALQAIEIEPPDLILMDITMPEMNGYEVCQAIKDNDRWKEIPVIFISSLTETFDKVKAFAMGGIDYISKPFQIDEVYARIETHLKVCNLQKELEVTVHNLEKRVEDQVKEISDSQIATIFALAKLAESRDDDTGKHLDRVRTFCKLLAMNLKGCRDNNFHISKWFVDTVYLASPLHDIGKVGIPDSILLKPGRLTSVEFEIMKRHTVIAAQTLEEVRQQYPNNGLIHMGIEIARSHHEHWDGSGYPDGLAGEAIPFSARIMAVADMYDALRSKRCYKPAFDQETACQMIVANRGINLDPVVVDSFLNIRDEFSLLYDQMMDEPGATKS